MKDFLGNEVKAGDKVVAIEPKYHSLVFATIDHINPKSVCIIFQSNKGYERKATSYYFIKLSDDYKEISYE